MSKIDNPDVDDKDDQSHEEGDSGVKCLSNGSTTLMVCMCMTMTMAIEMEMPTVKMIKAERGTV